MRTGVYGCLVGIAYTSHVERRLRHTIGTGKAHARKADTTETNNSMTLSIAERMWLNDKEIESVPLITVQELHRH